MPPELITKHNACRRTVPPSTFKLKSHFGVYVSSFVVNIKRVLPPPVPSITGLFYKGDPREWAAADCFECFLPTPHTSHILFGLSIFGGWFSCLTFTFFATSCFFRERGQIFKDIHIVAKARAPVQKVVPVKVACLLP